MTYHENPCSNERDTCSSCLVDHSPWSIALLWSMDYGPLTNAALEYYQALYLLLVLERISRYLPLQYQSPD